MNKALISTVRDKKAILFDLFHTLTALEVVCPSSPSSAELLGVSREDWHEQLMECSRDRLIGKMTDPHRIIKQMAHAIDPGISDELIAMTAAKRAKRFADALINMPAESVQTVKALGEAGKKLALVSNADVMEVQAWGQSPLAETFDVTIFSCDVGWAKPDREIYELSLRELGVCADECIFVGDGGSGELQGAQNCGITTVMVTGILKKIWPDKITARKIHADFVIENLSELLNNGG